MAWSEGHDKYAAIIGDVGVNFLQEFVDISLDSFDIEISCAPPILQDRSKLEQIIMLAVQTGELPVSDALQILLEKDVSVAARRFQRKYALRQMEAARQQQQEMQMQQQMQQQQLAAQDEMQNRLLQHQQIIENSGNETQLKKAALVSRQKLRSQQLDLLNT